VYASGIASRVVTAISEPIDPLACLDRAIRRLDARDRWSARHRRRVAGYSLAIATGAGLPVKQHRVLRDAALLHDVGKLHLPGSILAGVAPLTDREWELIQAHPRRGAEIVLRAGGSDELAAIVAAHHERVDGSGYPSGLRAAEIPALALIVGVAEAYDALTAEDSYQRPVGSLAALRRLAKAAGSQLEPRFVELLVGALAGGGLR
jgi:putative nucleotidyltransferase with HDIG domain